MKVNIFKNGQHVSTKEFSDPRVEFVRTFNGTDPSGTTKAVIVRTSEEKLKENILRLRYLWLPMATLAALIVSGFAVAILFVWFPKQGNPLPSHDQLLATENAAETAITVDAIYEPYDQIQVPVRALPSITAAEMISEPIWIDQLCHVTTVEVLTPKENDHKGYQLSLEIVDNDGVVVAKSVEQKKGQTQHNPKHLRQFEIIEYKIKTEQLLSAGEYTLTFKTISGPPKDSGHYVRVATVHCGTNFDGSRREVLVARVIADTRPDISLESMAPANETADNNAANNPSDS